MTDNATQRDPITPDRNEVSTRYLGVDQALASLKKRDAVEETAPDTGAKPKGYFMALAEDHAAGRTITGLPLRPNSN